MAYIKFAQHFTLCRKRAPHERTIHAGRESQSPTTADDTATRMMYECRATSADKRGRPARRVDEKGGALARCWTSARLLRANRSIHTYTHTHMEKPIDPSTTTTRIHSWWFVGLLVLLARAFVRFKRLGGNGVAEHEVSTTIWRPMQSVCVYGFVRHKHSQKKVGCWLREKLSTRIRPTGANKFGARF